MWQLRSRLHACLTLDSGLVYDCCLWDVCDLPLLLPRGCVCVCLYCCLWDVCVSASTAASGMCVYLPLLLPVADATPEKTWLRSWCVASAKARFLPSLSIGRPREVCWVTSMVCS